MTLPDEEHRAVNETREFLLKLLRPKATPGVPRVIRNEARWLLKHYPWPMRVDDLFGYSHDEQ